MMNHYGAGINRFPTTIYSYFIFKEYPLKGIAGNLKSLYLCSIKIKLVSHN